MLPLRISLFSGPHCYHHGRLLLPLAAKTVAFEPFEASVQVGSRGAAVCGSAGGAEAEELVALPQPLPARGCGELALLMPDNIMCSTRHHSEKAEKESVGMV